MNWLKKLFYIKYKYKDLGCSEYRVFKFIFFKFSQKIIDDSNTLYINNKKYSLKSFRSKNCKIYISGLNNTIQLPALKCFGNLKIYLNGSNNRIIIKDTIHNFRGLSIFMEQSQDNRAVIIDENCHCTSGFSIHCNGENVQVNIGKNCLFAGSSVILTTDYHKVYDLETNDLLNKDKSIFIADNVWLAAHSIVTKGAVIPEGCIVAMRSLVNKIFNEKNCILAGIPAKMVKRNIRWEK